MSDDTISRQEALALAKDLCVPAKDGTVYRHRCIDPDAIKDLPPAQPTLKGWICPVCGRGLSPFAMVCPCQNGKGWEITCKIR